MSKQFTSPFIGTDMTKMFDMSKFTTDFRIPQIDAEAIFSLQRKNMEAFAAMNQTVYESVQALCNRQAEAFRQMIEETTQTIQTIVSIPTPEGKAIKQAEVSKAALDKYIASLRDASETIAKCNNQALETVGTRLNEGMSELRSIVKITDRAA